MGRIPVLNKRRLLPKREYKMFGVYLLPSEEERLRSLAERLIGGLTKSKWRSQVLRVIVLERLEKERIA